MKKLFLFFALLCLVSCANELYPSSESYMKAKGVEEPSPARFAHCQNYDCAVVKNVELSKQDWKAIDKAFGKKGKSAQEERIKISRIIGMFERILGPITKTQNDKRGTFIQTGDGQLDCVDESTNTTVYLELLRQKGLLQHHDILQPQVRWPLISGRGWMHQTAVIRDRKTGAEFAVDSWFEDNGADAWVVSMEDWRDGWHPSLITDGKGPRALGMAKGAKTD